MPKKKGVALIPDVLAARVEADTTDLASAPHRKLLFVARNGHVESCGEPPQIHADDYRFASYFENRFGEQAVFTYDGSLKKGVLRFGDMEWDWSKEITKPEDIGDSGLEEELKLWLMASWISARSAPLAEVFAAVQRGEQQRLRWAEAHAKGFELNSEG